MHVVDLKARILQKHRSLREFALSIEMPYSTLDSVLKRGVENSSVTSVIKICNALGISVEEARTGQPSERQASGEVIPITHPDFLALPKMKKVPLLGTIACGEPILAIEEAAEFVDMPEFINADFCLRCKGDSMIGAHIYDGDLVFIRQQAMVENGEIAAVVLDDEATLKRVYKIYHNDSLAMLELRAENPAIPPLIVSGEDLAGVQIEGKAVYYIGKVR